MENDNTFLLKIRRIIVGLFGISLVIIIHEFGHFIFCKIFGVGTPVFSIGFDPAIFQKRIGQTIFQIGAIPLGGYVSINSNDLAQIAYLKKMAIIFAGIFFNLVLGFAILFYLKLKKHESIEEIVKENENVQDFEDNLQEQNKNSDQEKKKTSSARFIGPVGIINLIGKSIEVSFDTFLYYLAIVSLNVGFFNLLPIPFFDGGQALQFTIEAITGKDLSSGFTNIIYIIFFIILIILTVLLAYKDILRLNKKD